VVLPCLVETGCYGIHECCQQCLALLPDNLTRHIVIDADNTDGAPLTGDGEQVTGDDGALFRQFYVEGEASAATVENFSG